MHRLLPGIFLITAVLLPTNGNAQAFQFRTPDPPATAEYAEWQFNGEPILVNGLIYGATRGTRLFDGLVMVQVDTYRGVPVYADITREPFTLVYVPIGRQLLRAYAHDARTPSSGELAAVGTTGWLDPATRRAGTRPAEPREAPRVSASHAATMRIETIPRPASNDGIWIEYRGTRWYSAGAAVVFTPERFLHVGTYRGFDVYRDVADIASAADRLWISVVPGGPVAPYAKR